MNRKYSKVVSLLGTTLLTISLLSACGQGTKDVIVKEDSPKKEEVKTTKKEVKPKQSKLGSRTNPVPFKKTATVDDELYNDNGDSFPIKFDLTVEEVVRGDAAYAKLKSMNEFNDPTPEGYEWILTKVKVKFVKSATEDLAFNIDGIMNFKVVSESGDIYSGDVYGTTDPDFSYEMYVGNEKEGYIANLVKTGEKAQLRYEEFIGGQVFFNLQ
ncbi:hypothetical protein AN960_20785 [Bacillus sp. FJAT-25509]|uniref:hypothetical protein n=1 Tax=Bacillus sp. FJAT-25509 TaxID=1712029 RepID=UPI00070023AB|nr:hypothetical protein [Bacillus sp. FJAT-25509]KQL33515.1 hypothetical protein AN960_20785 [Bacillus sp. FJAT-25509]